MGYYRALKYITMSIIALKEKRILLGNEIRKENFKYMIRLKRNTYKKITELCKEGIRFFSLIFKE